MTVERLDQHRVSLDAIATEPERAVELAPADAAKLLARGSAVVAALTAALSTMATASTATEAHDEDRMLDVDEIAALLHRPRAWIVRNRGQLPFLHQVSPKHFLASEKAARRWIATRGRGEKN